MKKYSKKIKRQLRELSGLAYKRELEHFLTNLKGKFDKWHNGNIDCWKLVDSIHDFHNGDARNLYKQYIMNKNSDLNVVHALNNGIIKNEEVPDEVMGTLKIV